MALGVNDLHGNPIVGSNARTLPDRSGFYLGNTLILPGSREVSGPAGEATIEPRVMQVLVALADAGGEVVTRSELSRICWDGQFVGDDALNRAIGQVRKLARTVAADDFAVETIPRTGYRLTGAVRVVVETAIEPQEGAVALTASSTAMTMPSRRLLMIAGVAGIASAGIATWAWRPEPKSARVAMLLDQADVAMRQDLPDPAVQGIGFIREAATLAPDSPKVWGRLALALCAASEFAGLQKKSMLVDACQVAAARALERDKRQPDALAALALLQPEYGDWLAAEARLRAILAIDPLHEATLAAYGVLLQGVGRTRDNIAVGAGLVERFPLAPIYAYRRMYMLWNGGRLGDADRQIDRSLELWPRHPAIWFARFWLLAMTDRAAAALAMLDDVEAWPATLSAQHAAGIRISLVALATRRAIDISAAVEANNIAVMKGPTWAIYAIMILTRLGELDAAFAIAEGYLLRRGPFAGQLRHTSAQPSTNDQRHRKTMMLFIPSAAPMRADPRFIDLCRDMGMVDYWRQSGHRPDFLGNRQIA